MKNRLIVFVFFLFGMLLSGEVMAQTPVVRSEKITKIGSKEYYMHSVKAGQTLYSISKVYNVSIEEIETLNPDVKNGLKVGHVLGIPVRPVPTPQVEEPEAQETKEVENQEVEKPKVQETKEPEAQEVKEPEAQEVKEPEVQEVKEPEVQEVKEPEVQEVKEPEVQEVKEPEVQEVKEPEVQEVKEPEAQEVKEPEAQEIKEPEVQEIKEPEAQEVKEPEAKEQEDPEIPKAEEIETPEVKTPEVQEEAPNVQEVEEPEVKEPEKTEIQETKEPESQSELEPKEAKNLKQHIVKKGEDLYDIAKKYGIDLADFKSANVGLDNEPATGTAINIPSIANENDYIVHKCERNERVTSMLKRWKVEESTFREKNVSVGSHVFVNQVVLIPIKPITDFYWMPKDQDQQAESEQEEVKPTEEEGHETVNFFEEMGEIPECVSAPENATRRYKVALLIPLYLNEMWTVDALFTDSGKGQKQKARPLSFLQFYEGFMMAVDRLKNDGLKMDLTVLDVTDDVSTANRALSQIADEDFDLIIGPFFSKSFSVIEEYAKANEIVVVNPLSTRSSVIEDSPNVVKVKPGDMGMVLTISNLVRNAYNDSNVFIVSQEKPADSVFLNQLEHHLNLAINEEVTVSGDEFLQFARNESERQEMGSRLVPTVDVEGQVYSIGDFESGVTDKVVLANSVKRYPYSQIGEVHSQLSGVRNNLIVAYGDDNVFATMILNSFIKDADRYPITLIAAPDWSKFEKLHVDRLLKMNTIYVSDFFVDYNDEEVKRFVLQFRNRYVSEPQKYAFEGYDMAYYFLSALMLYGDNVMDCLHCYKAALMHTNYRFYYKNYLKSGLMDGKENLDWSLYQFDQEDIELHPVDPFKKTEE